MAKSSRADAFAGAAAFGAGFATLAGLVAAGSVSGLDAYLVEHWTPSATSAEAAQEPSLVDALVPFYGLDDASALEVVTTVVSLPGFVVVSTALFASPNTAGCGAASSGSGTG
jgi:hypothetical protein